MLLLKGNCTLRASEERRQRETFGPKNTEQTGIWRKLHNEKLRDFHFSPYSNMMIQLNQSKIIWDKIRFKFEQLRGTQHFREIDIEMRKTFK